MLDLSQPGLHNLENAAAAALVAIELGIEPARVEGLLPRFPGVARRFEVIGTTTNRIRIVDDYAHNGEKIRAAITTAQADRRGSSPVPAPRFGPARFLRPELRELLPRCLFLDRFALPRDLLRRHGHQGFRAGLADDLPPDPPRLRADHAAAVDWSGEVQTGDTVLIMGARRPRAAAPGPIHLRRA
jgi:UDP-N-acetylmuramate--alanine ligase